MKGKSDVMKATGLVRRIDELGRIVIPKEIRKTLRIRDGEPLEIFVEKDMILFKKYSSLTDLNDLIALYIDTIFNSLKKSMIVTNRDKIIACSIDVRKDYLNKNLSTSIESMLDERGSFLQSDRTNFEIVDGIKENVSYAASTILVDGDAIGLVMFISHDDNVSANEENIAMIVSNLITKQMD